MKLVSLTQILASDGHTRPILVNPDQVTFLCFGSVGEYMGTQIHFAAGSSGHPLFVLVEGNLPEVKLALTEA